MTDQDMTDEGAKAAPDIFYCICANDRLIEVGGNWDGFACENGGSSVLSAKVKGQSIFRHICGESWKRLYSELFRRIRETKNPISFEYRCDAPDRVRFMRMTIKPGDSPGSLCLTSETLFQRERPIRDQDSAAIKKVFRSRCGWCGKFLAANGKWMEIEDLLPLLNLERIAEPPLLSAGICPTCAANTQSFIDGN